MLLVMALDVLTRVPLAATVLPHDGSERAGLLAFKAGMQLLVDRGFPAKDLLASLVARGADVLWRMGTAECNSWDCVHRFLHDRAKPLEARVFYRLNQRVRTAYPPSSTFDSFAASSAEDSPQKGQKREVLVLITTLLNATAWPADKLIASYERRWVIEDWFRDIKVCFGQEAFHCRSDVLIEQAIYSLLACITVCAIVERDAYRCVESSRGRQNPSNP
jgi:hypothetical protein